MFPGEEEAIKTVCDLGAKYGYGNLISHLKNTWSKHLQEKWKIDKQGADIAAGHICVWCYTDSRTGQKLEK